jgi:hypothetical protein
MTGFSIFSDDDTLGLDNSRVVVLRGTTTVSQLFSPNLFNIGDWIRTALENKGFSVVAVRTSAAAWIGYANNLEIELNVFNNFTSEQARVNAILAIEAYTANFGLNKVFSNTTLAVAYDAYVPPASTSGTTRNPVSPVPSRTPSVFDQSIPTSDSTLNFWSAAGLTTPVAVVGAGLLLLLLLRR